MSKDKNTKKAADKPKEHEFTIEELMLHCEAIIGHKREVAAGALYGCNKDKMAKTEFKERVDEFLKKVIEKKEGK